MNVKKKITVRVKGGIISADLFGSKDVIRDFFSKKEQMKPLARTSPLAIRLSSCTCANQSRRDDFASQK